VTGAVKGTVEFGVRTGGSFAAGSATSYASKHSALGPGADESTAELIGLGAFFVGGGLAGRSLSNVKFSYAPGSRGMPRNNICFIAGTLIHTPDGMVPIETLTPGDLVIATDPGTGETTAQPIEETYVRQGLELVYLTVGDCEIVVTPDHPFYVVGAGWLPAKHLTPGMLLHTLTGVQQPLQHTHTETHHSPVTVYNLKVHDYHTYHVGYRGVLVHNQGYTKQSINQVTTTTTEAIPVITKPPKPRGKRLAESAEKETGSTARKFGESGTQLAGSKTTGRNGKTERVDVENPAPGKRDGDVHYHDSTNVKWRYDHESGKLIHPVTHKPAPPKVQKVTTEKWFQKALDKALTVLGET
jgi:hypothetical protein